VDTNATFDDDVKAIKKLGEEFFSGVNTEDLDRRMATMDPEVVIMPPGRPSIVGKEEIRRLSHDYAETYEEECSLAYDEVDVSGNWGFARATVSATRTSRSDGAVEKLTLKNLWIFKKQAGGEWKFWRIMFNNTIPCTPKVAAP